MYRRMLKSMMLASLAVLVTVPASAQVRADVGPLHIRIVNEAPPRVRVERRLARPDRDSVWIRGYWDRQDTRWEWVPGRWERPSGRARWIDARYRRDGGAYVYEPAHWSNQRIVEGDDYVQWRNEHHRNRRY